MTAPLPNLQWMIDDEWCQVKRKLHQPFTYGANRQKSKPKGIASGYNLSN